MELSSSDLTASGRDYTPSYVEELRKIRLKKLNELRFQDQQKDVGKDRGWSKERDPIVL